MTRSDVERRLRRVRWPEPAADLRARVLAAAPIINRRVTWSDRVWFSRGWRVAAAAAAAGALAIASLPDAADSMRMTPASQAVAEAQVVDDAGREIGLPPNVAQALAQRALSTGARAAAAGHMGLAVQGLGLEGEIK